jgi:hypothetical protein
MAELETGKAAPAALKAGLKGLVFSSAKEVAVGADKKAVEYDGARDLDGLTAFLKKNVKTAFTLPAGEDAGAEDDMHEL